MNEVVGLIRTYVLRNEKKRKVLHTYKYSSIVRVCVLDIQYSVEILA